MPVYDEVIARLSQLGYTVPDSGTPDTTVVYSINSATEKIKANINNSEIPEGLHYTWVDMAVGLFLFDKKAAGQLGETFDFSAAIKKISEGDVSVEYSDNSSTPEAMFDKLISGLVNPPPYIFARFRRLAW